MRRVWSYAPTTLYLKYNLVQPKWWSLSFILYLLLFEYALVLADNAMVLTKLDLK